MGDLAVTVRLHGQVVEDQVVPVRRMVRIGEAPAATVSFPGADLAVVRVDGGLLVRGRCLREGEELHLALGAVEVGLAHTQPGSLPSDWKSALDTRFLLCALLVAAVGAWFDAAERWLDRQAPVPSEPALFQALDRLLTDAPQPAGDAASVPRTR